MNYYSRILGSLLCLLLFMPVFGQTPQDAIPKTDIGATLILIDRPSMKVDKVHWDSTSVYYVKKGKKKLKSMDITKVYSIVADTGFESVVYVQDTLENNWYTSEQMKDYILGQQDAAKAYKPRANKSAAGGVMFGFVGSATGLFYGPLFVIGYTFWKGNALPAFEKEYGYNMDYSDNPYYKEGFGTMAKRYTTRRSALGAAAGYVLGAVTLTLVIR